MLAVQKGVSAAGAERAPANPYELDSAPVPRGPIDEIVFGRLKRRGIPSARPCSDAVFLRRAFLDVAGTLPTPEEARQFLRDRSPDRRQALIERLLEREEFADYAAMKWCDRLRVKSEFPINLWPNAAHAYHRWIRTALRDNIPFDRLVRELLTASGSNFRVPPVNFYRAVPDRKPETLARAVALAFMGARFEKWPKARQAGMAAFFSQLAFKPTGEWKEEIAFFDPGRAVARAGGVTSKPVFPDGRPARIAPGQDPREVIAAWLTAPGNPWFARSVANRVWSWLLGRGIVHEPDDFRPDNPPSNPELLVWLQKDLTAGRFDLKRLYRTILNSSVYQLSSIPASAHPAAEQEFAHYPLRRLEAEVLIDVLNQITGTKEAYSSAVPEPFTFLPENQRAVALPDGSITSPFLELFGRPARDTGLEGERNNSPTTAQRLHMLNSSHIRRKLEQGSGLLPLTRFGRRPGEVVNALYLAILSRFPTEDERRIAEAHARPDGTLRRDGLADIAWALVNSAEFLYQH